MKLFRPTQVYNYFRSQWHQTDARVAVEPTTICLYMSKRCTLQCRWCLRSTTPGLPSVADEDMTLLIATQILQQFPRATHLSLGGFGEPLLARDIFKICAHARRRPMRINLITNGTLLPDRLGEVRSAGLHRLSVSLNALSAAEHQSVCGGVERTYSQILDAIDRLRSLPQRDRPLLHISFVLTPDLLPRIEEIIDLAERIGVDHLDLHNKISYEDAANTAEMLTTEDWRLVEWLRRMASQPRKVTIGWPVLITRDLDRPGGNCECFWTWIGVDSSGNTAGCSKALPTDYTYGNVFREGTGVWNNEYRRGARRDFLRGQFPMGNCRTCTLMQPKIF